MAENEFQITWTAFTIDHSVGRAFLLAHVSLRHLVESLFEKELFVLHVERLPRKVSPSSC